MRLSTNRRGGACRLQQGLVTDFAAKQRGNNKAIKFGLLDIREVFVSLISCEKKEK